LFLYIKNMELVQNKEGLVATLTVKISQEDYAAKVEKELKKIRQTSQLKGFRPGNAPISLIKKMYGQSVLLEEINKLILESVENYEKENEGKLLSQVIPATNIQSMNLSVQTDFEFVYEACFFPEFTYQIDENTELTYYNIFPEDKDIDDEIDFYRESQYTDEHVEEIEDDCLINVDVNLIKEGEEKTHNTDILISVIPDEYKALFLGAKTGDSVSVEIRKVFTSEIDLMGMLEINRDELELLPQSLLFTIIDISKKTPPKEDQNFFDTIAGKDKIHSMEELREYARKLICDNNEKMSLDKLYRDSIEILKEKTNITLPEDFVRKYIRFIQKENSEITDEEFESVVNYYTEKTTLDYITDSLLKPTGEEITAEMVTDEMKEIIAEKYHQYQFENNELDNLINYYLQNEEYVRNIVNRLKRKKIAHLMKEKAKLNVIDISMEEFHNLLRSKVNEEYNTLEDDTETEETETDETAPSEPLTENQETVTVENQEGNGDTATSEPLTENQETVTVENQEDNKEEQA
jgi:trigger factor